MTPVNAPEDLPAPDLDRIEASPGISYASLGVTAQELKQLLDLEDYGLRDSMGLCGTCGTMKKIMFLKGRKLLWCPDCEHKGLDRLLCIFADAVEQARRDLGLAAVN